MNKKPNIRDLVLSGDWSSLTEEVHRRFDVIVDTKNLQDACSEALRKHLGKHGEELFRAHCLGPDGQESSWQLWLKNRLDEMGVCTAHRTGQPDATSVTSAVLHIFFLYLEETEDMLERLRREPVGTESQTARSKLAKTNQKNVRPIDKTAFRVAPPPKDQS